MSRLKADLASHFGPKTGPEEVEKLAEVFSRDGQDMNLARIAAALELTYLEMKAIKEALHGIGGTLHSSREPSAPPFPTIGRNPRS